ncbi:MAG TPA: carboxypeptidase regulatory-like domain-containing protein, partial [Candidatus Binatia bacterium]
MLKRIILLAVIASLNLIPLAFVESIPAQDRSGNLQGVVKDAAGAPVAGAFVKLKNSERRVTFMVISQARGRYSVNNLPLGKYTLQAIGGEFQSELSAPVDVTAGKPVSLGLALTSPRAPQLAPAWPGRLPGELGGEAEAATRAAPVLPEGTGKSVVEAKCATACHDAQRIVRFRGNRSRWEEVIRNMRLYAQGSTLAKDLTAQEEKILLDYAVTNFGARQRTSRPKPDPNSRLPRTLVQGEAAKYIAVEFELPNSNAEPHEVAVDSDGNGWVSQRRGGHLGRLDPKTLLYTEIAPPPAASNFLRLNGIRSGPNNQLWLMDGGPNRRWLSYDTKTKMFSVFELPKTKSGNASGNTMRVHPNGTVWLNSIGGNQVIRLDPKTKQFTFFDVPSGVKAERSASPYGMAIAGDGMIWFA